MTVRVSSVPQFELRDGDSDGVGGTGTLEEESEPVINWSASLLPHSRLHPLHNGGMGDCLLHRSPLSLGLDTETRRTFLHRDCIID